MYFAADDLLALQSGQEENYKYDHWLNVGYRKVFQFEVRACTTAVLTLRYKAQIEEQIDTAEIQLDANGSKSVLTFFDLQGNVNVSKTFNEPTGVGCNSFAILWLSWADHRFRLGRGRDYGENYIFDEVEELGRIVQSLHLSSKKDGKVDWVFDRHEGRSAVQVKLYKWKIRKSRAKFRNE